MKIGQYNIKKRYIAGGLLALIVLVKCTGGSDEPERIEYAPQQQQQIQPTPAPQQYDDAQQAVAPQYAAPAPAAAPVTIVNTPSGGHSDSGFFNGFLMGHILGNSGGGGGGGSRDSSYYRNSTTKKTVVNNHYYNEPKPAPAPAPAAKPKKPGLTTSYTSQPPAQFQNKTWATNSRKGWGAAPRTRASGKPAFRSRSRSRRR